MVSVTINGSSVTFERPLVFNKDTTEEFNGGTLVLKNIAQEEAYADYSDVVITLESIQYEFTIKGDIVTRTSDTKWTHTITLQENVVKLVDVFMPDRLLDTRAGVRLTWLEHLETILDTYELNSPTPYTIASSTQTLLDVDGEEKEYTGGNLLTNITELFRAVKAVPTLSHANVIGHQLLGEKGNKILNTALTSNIKGKVIQSDTEDYGQSVYSKVKNGAYEKDLEVGATWFPSISDGITVRSSGNKYTDETAEIPFNDGIRRITESYIVDAEVTVSITVQGAFGAVSGVDVPVSGTNGDQYVCDSNGYNSVNAGAVFNNGDTATWVQTQWIKNISSPHIMDVDITPYVLFEEDWKKKEIATTSTTLFSGIYQNNTYYWTSNGLIKNIGVDYQTNTILSPTAYELLLNSWEDNIALNDSLNLSILPGKGIKNEEYRFKYIPRRNFDTKQERHYSNRVLKKSVKYNEQKDSQVELSRFGSANGLYINRLGNDKFELTLLYNLNDSPTLIETNDYTEDLYRVVKATYKAYDSKIEATYLFAKNVSILNPLESFVDPVSRYTITTREVLSNFTENKYIEFSSTLRGDTATELGTRFKSVFLNRFDYDSLYNTPIYSAAFVSSDAEETYTALKTQKAVMDRTLVLNAQFTDKTIAGVKKESTGLANLTDKMTPVNYTNDFGEVTTARVLWNYKNNLQPDDYPVLLPPVVSDIIIEEDDADVYLAPNEIYGKTYAIHAVTDRENLIVYPRLWEENNLVKLISSEETLTAYLYEVDDVYFTTEDRDVPSGSVSTLTVNFVGTDAIVVSPITGSKSWCIADSDNKIIWAYNNLGTNLGLIRINYMDENPNINDL